MTPEEIIDAISMLTISELAELRLMLEEEGWLDEGGLGVREPREPTPPEDDPGFAKELPEDYWETAQ